MVEESRRPTTGSETSMIPSSEAGSVKLNDIIACHLQKYDGEEPQIGRVVALKGEQNRLDVHWMHGSYSDVWTPCQQKRGRVMEPFIEEISSTDVLYPIELSRSSRIPEPYKKKLKLSYSAL